MKTYGLFAGALAVLLAVAWGVSFGIPSRKKDVYEAVIAELPPRPPVAEVCAVVDLRLGVRLTAEDVAAWQVLSADGESPVTALRTVVSYRRAVRRRS